MVAAGCGVWLMARDSSDTTTSTTETVGSQTIQQTVSADGTIAARRTADETFAVSGTVTRVAVEEGDRVARGAVLAVVDSDALVAARAAAASSLDAALTQLDDDEDSGASDVQLAADQATVVSARATLAEARQAVEDATLRASVAGTVTSVGISRGDSVGSSSSAPTTDTSTTTTTTTTTTTSSITIVSTRSFVVDATVAAEDVDRLKEGLQAEITATGVDETVFGTVSEVGLVAQTNDSGAAVFPVTIEVTGTKRDLYAGVAATASIIVKQVPDVLTVPSRALTTEDGTTYVTKVVDGDEVRTEVEIGDAYGMSTEVTAGLEEGDEVVVPGFTRPTGGDDGGEAPQDLVFPGGGQLPPGLSEMGPPQ
ncbi:macrolide transporter subunit MacA [Nocardioides caricicola]